VRVLPVNHRPPFKRSNVQTFCILTVLGEAEGPSAIGEIRRTAQEARRWLTAPRRRQLSEQLASDIRRKLVAILELPAWAVWRRKGLKRLPIIFQGDRIPAERAGWSFSTARI
jgi:hypothetical protein